MDIRIERFGNKKVRFVEHDGEWWAVLKDVAELAVSYYTTYAIMSNGDLYSWGYNGTGECGIGNTTNQVLPKKIKLLLQLKILVFLFKVNFSFFKNSLIFTKHVFK